MATRRLVSLAMMGLVFAVAAAPQAAAEEDFRIFADHPRLFLNARRLRLLEREVQRQSLRWRQFKQLMDGRAQWPEAGFAMALYARVSGDDAYCREAVRWALAPGADLRQAAIVFDWCQPALGVRDSAALAEVLERGIASARGKPGVSAARDRVLAAVALAGHRTGLAENELRSAVHQWWRGRIVPAIVRGEDALPRPETLALFELLHAVRDNLNLDLRDPLQAFFHGLPYALLLSYYPGAYPGGDNHYHIPAGGAWPPDLREAVRARAGDLCLVAFDSNTQGSQFLQGFLNLDPLLMRGSLGIPYEFLWANPYLPGLSYHHAPPYFHDQRRGRLYVRSDWTEDATWVCYQDGRFQVFDQGEPKLLKVQPSPKPLRLGRVAVLATQGAGSYQVRETGLEMVFLVGLRPSRTYELWPGQERVILEAAGPGGIIGLAAPSRGEFTIRIRETRQ